MNQTEHPESHKLAISILSVSIIVFLYFAIMILLNKLNYHAQFLKVIAEMLTIPAFLILTVCSITSLFLFVKNKFRINSFAFYSLLIELVTAGLIFYIA